MTKRRTNVPGTVYLLHFDKKYHHAQHYIGWTEDEVRERLDAHFHGNGSKLVKAVIKAKIDVCLVRVWKGKDRNFERQLKNRKNASKMCPLCK